MKYKILSIILCSLMVLTACGSKGLTADEVISASVSESVSVDTVSVSAEPISVNKPQVILDTPVEKIRDTVIKETPFELSVTDHGNISTVTDGYYKNFLYEKLRKIADDTDMMTNTQMTLDRLYNCGKDGILVDFDYMDGTHSYFVIHSDYSFVCDKGNVFLLPAKDASEVEKALIESESVVKEPDLADPGVGDAVKLFKDSGYKSQHPYKYLDMKLNSISTVHLKNDTGEAEIVENNDYQTPLHVSRINEDGDRYIDLTGLSDDDLEITVKGAEPYIRLEYDTGYAIEISTGYDLTINCDRDGNIILKDVYAGDDLKVKYTIPKESYKYFGYETFTFNGMVMEPKYTSIFLKEGYWQIYGPVIANAALSGTPDDHKHDLVSDFVDNTHGNYIYDFNSAVIQRD